MGHDRCPIFLEESAIDTWLNPKNNNIETMYSVLKDKTKTFYNYEWAG